MAFSRDEALALYRQGVRDGMAMRKRPRPEIAECHSGITLTRTDSVPVSPSKETP